MTTWILDADPERARIFQQRSPRRKAVLYLEIERPARSLYRQITRELDLACEADAESRLVIYGEERTLAKLLPHLGTKIRNRLVGAFSRESVAYAL